MTKSVQSVMGVFYKIVAAWPITITSLRCLTTGATQHYLNFTGIYS
jgi:hypothetical protein